MFLPQMFGEMIQIGEQWRTYFWNVPKNSSSGWSHKSVTPGMQLPPNQVVSKVKSD